MTDLSPSGSPVAGGNAPAQGFAPPRQPPQSLAGSSTDKVITIVLIVLGAGASLAGSFWAAFSVMATSSCGDACGAGANWGITVMLVGPWIIWLAASIWAIVRLVRRQAALRIMIGAGIVAAVIYVLANVMLAVAVA